MPAEGRRSLNDREPRSESRARSCGLAPRWVLATLLLLTLRAGGQAAPASPPAVKVTAAGALQVPIGARVVVERVAVRAAPSASAESFGTLNRGDEVTIVGQTPVLTLGPGDPLTASLGWFAVLTPKGLEGWVEFDALWPVSTWPAEWFVVGDVCQEPTPDSWPAERHFLTEAFLEGTRRSRTQEDLLRVLPLFLRDSEYVQGPLDLSLSGGGNTLLLDESQVPARLFVLPGSGNDPGKGPSLFFVPVSGSPRKPRAREPRPGTAYWEGEPLPTTGPIELSSWARSALERAGRERTGGRVETCRWQLPAGELWPLVVGFCSIGGQGPRPEALIVFDRQAGQSDRLQRIWLAPPIVAEGAGAAAVAFSFGDPSQVLAVDLDGDEHPEVWFEGELELGERSARLWLLLVDTGGDLIGPFRVVRDGCAGEEE